MILRLIALAVTLALLGCDGRPRLPLEDSRAETADASTKRTGTVLHFDLTRGAPESIQSGLLFSLPAKRTYTGLIRALEKAQADKEATGFFVSLGTESFDLAQTEEIGERLFELRKNSNKPITCHADGLDNSSAWLVAQACDRIWLSEAGTVETVGIASQVVYLKSLLDKIGVEADFIHMGRYKSAAESLTRDGPTEAARKSLVGALRSIRKAWLDSASNHRKDKDVRQALEHGPWDAPGARREGLIDALGYESEARSDAKERAHAGELETSFGGKRKREPAFDVAEIIRILAGIEPAGEEAYIAVVPAEGSIAMSSGGLMSDMGITVKAFIRTIRKLKKDDAVKAVVLRIDSPGGSALGSDLIWHELMQLRDEKPLITSVGGMAASGGYYLACASNRIVAERTSIVGSIGVVGGKIVVTEALGKIGVSAVTFPASPEPGAAARAAYLSPLEPWNEETRAKVKQQMKTMYELFLARVAEGRGHPIENPAEVAEGRIWSGVQGKDRGLVDEIGGLGRALEIARQLAGVDRDIPIKVEGARESLLEMLMLGEGATDAEVTAAVARYRARGLGLLEQVSAPLRPFVASLGPLVNGEAVVAALPFGLVIR